MINTVTPSKVLREWASVLREERSKRADAQTTFADFFEKIDRAKKEANRKPPDEPVPPGPPPQHPPFVTSRCIEPQIAGFLTHAREIGEWDLSRLMSPSRCWPTTGCNSEHFDNSRVGLPAWKPGGTVGVAGETFPLRPPRSKPVPRAGLDKLRLEIRRLAMRETGPPNYKGVFRDFDRDDSGELDRREFRMALEELGIDFTTNEFAAIFDHFDKDGGGSIARDEFVQFLVEGRVNSCKAAARHRHHSARAGGSSNGLAAAAAAAAVAAGAAAASAAASAAAELAQTQRKVSEAESKLQPRAPPACRPASAGVSVKRRPVTASGLRASPGGFFCRPPATPLEEGPSQRSPVQGSIGALKAGMRAPKAPPVEISLAARDARRGRPNTARPLRKGEAARHIARADFFQRRYSDASSLNDNGASDWRRQISGESADSAHVHFGFGEKKPAA